MKANLCICTYRLAWELW